MKVEFSRHNINEEDIEEVNDTLRSLFITTANKTKKFENDFADYFNVNHAIGLNSATAGLHLSLLALGIGQGDEVITTSLTFIATANVIVMVGAKPIFVDVNIKTGLMDLDEVKKKITSKTKAIIPVHLYGNMVDMKSLKTIADKNNLSIIEDAAHCIEGDRDGVKPGELSDTACFSFYATKNLSCGEGGAVITNNKTLADKLSVLRLHGMSKNAADRYKKHSFYDMQEVGFKYNMSDIQASLLIHQFKRLDSYLEKREFLASRYEDFFDSVGLDYPKISKYCKSSRHLSVVWVDPTKRDYIIEQLQKYKIGVSVHFSPIHLMSYYKNLGYKKGDFPNTEKISSSTISLPLYSSLKIEEQNYIFETLKKIL